MTDHTPIQTLISRIAADTGAVGKDSRNQQQGFNFRGIDAVTQAVYPALVKHGVVILPDVQSVDYEQGTTRNGGGLTLCRVIVRYTFWGPAGDSLAAVVAAEAMDSGDKATAKAMSVAFRTALLQVLTLPTDDPDPDSFVYEQGTPTARPTARPTAPDNGPGNPVYAAIQNAPDIDALRAAYRHHKIGEAPEHIQVAFRRRADALAAAAAQVTPATAPEVNA